MPAMLEAVKLGSRAAKVGFDWPDVNGLFAKLAEEIAELREEVVRNSADRIEAEFGDLLFTAMNLARHLKLDAESALRHTNATFRARFAAMEAAAGGSAALQAMNADQLEEAKQKEQQARSGNDIEVAASKEEAKRDLDRLLKVVFIKTGDKVRLQKVETGIADNAMIEVKSGVKPGDEVVSGSYAAISRQLKDGSKVRIEKPKPEAVAAN